MTIFKRKQPWRNALLATTMLSLFLVLSSLLWSSGYQEWAFLLAFAAIWVLISLSWSNVDFTEESSSILARIVDHNFEEMHVRIEELEQELASLRALPLNEDRAGTMVEDPARLLHSGHG